MGGHHVESLAEGKMEMLVSESTTIWSVRIMSAALNKADDRSADDNRSAVRIAFRNRISSSSGEPSLGIPTASRRSPTVTIAC